MLLKLPGSIIKGDPRHVFASSSEEPAKNLPFPASRKILAVYVFCLRCHVDNASSDVGRKTRSYLVECELVTPGRANNDFYAGEVPYDRFKSRQMTKHSVDGRRFTFILRVQNSIEIEKEDHYFVCRVYDIKNDGVYLQLQAYPNSCKETCRAVRRCAELTFPAALNRRLDVVAKNDD